ncbi:MAG: FecR domain-containing protein [Cyclobacteriaceae bacterium]
MEELIFKYLNKTLNQQEYEQLQSWLELDEENRIILNKLISFYRNNESKLSGLKEEVWSEINERLERPDVSLNPKHFINMSRLLKIAAIFLIISASVFVMNQFAGENEIAEVVAVKTISKEAPFGRKVTTQLPDGSLVTLNSGSKIRYPERFSNSAREVSLSGEAFFEVEHNPDKPFLVQMNGDIVRVLGTSFNIRSYNQDSAVYVSVATGRVSYSIPSGDEVVLEPDRMATYLPKQGSLSTGEVDKLRAFGWKDKVLYFDNITFDKVIIEVERWYGVEIDYPEELVSRGTYSEQFNNPTLAEVLHSLSFVYRFNFDIEESKVTINKTKTLSPKPMKRNI